MTMELFDFDKKLPEFGVYILCAYVKDSCETQYQVCEMVSYRMTVDGVYAELEDDHGAGFLATHWTPLPSPQKAIKQ